MNVLKIENLATTYGLRFKYDKVDHVYVLSDAKTGEVIMTYAEITVESIKNIAIWREEFAKMRIV